MTGLTRKTDEDIKAGSADSTDAFPKSPDDPFGLAEWLREMPKVPLHPLMQHPAAAMAAMTAIGIGMTGQLAGAMLGAMQGLAETTRKAPEAPQPVEDAPKAKAEPPKAVVVSMTPKRATKAAPVETVKAPRKPKVVAAKNEKAADDLKKISGIGPKLEQVLNGMGIRHYAQIAAWTDKDIARVDGQLGFAGRIVRDGWVGQAGGLVKGAK